MQNDSNILSVSCPWQSMEIHFGAANVKWCEQRLCSLINEPANAWSNILYIFLGLFLIWKGYKNQKNKSGQFQFVFGCVVYIMGFFSFIYHSTNNYLTQIFDFIGMFFYVYLLLSLSLYNFKIITARFGLYLWLALSIISTLMIPLSRLIHFPYQAIVGIAAVIIVILQAIQFRKNPANYPVKPLIFCLLFFISGVIFSYLDVKGIFCNPENHFMQGHAIWHLLSAVGVYFAYLMFSKQISERISK